jgi:hypothetical protein
MLTKTIVAAAVAVMLGTVGTSFAAGPKSDAGVKNSNAAGSVDRDKGQDRAMERRSDMGNANANNPSSPNRATGTDRAEDRHELNTKRKDARTDTLTTTPKAKPHKSSLKTIPKVKDAPDFRAQTREERMAAAHASWQRSSKL